MATRRAVIGSRGADFLSWRAYGYHGMTAVIVTPSLDRSWVRPLGLLRGQGVSTVVVLLDRLSFVAAEGARHWPKVEVTPAERHAADEDLRALRHALAEYAIPLHVVPAGRPLPEALAS